MSSSATADPKPGLHPRNRHRGGYDFAALARSSPELAKFVRASPVGKPTIDFADPSAVLALNRALLKHAYGVSHWDVPPGYLCPPVPGRADYVHQIADLLAAGGAVPRGSAVSVLDIGVGANCIYPILGVCEYGWRFVGTELDPVAAAAARKIATENTALAGRIAIRLQRDASKVFSGVTDDRETFAAAMCNPPFYASAREAAAGTLRKLRNLHGRQPATPLRNFGGRSHELWCAGGELAWVRRMIEESAQRPALCGWFTTLVANRESLPAISRALRAVKAADVRTLPLAQGQKKSRIVAWRFERR